MCVWFFYVYGWEEFWFGREVGSVRMVLDFEVLLFSGFENLLVVLFFCLGVMVLVGA